MKNRIVLVSLALLLAVGVVAIGCPPPPVVEVEVLPWPGYPAPEFEWTGQSIYPAGVHSHIMFEKLAERIHKITRGQLEITAHPAPALVPVMEVPHAVTVGFLDIGLGWPPVWMGMDPAFMLFCPGTAGLSLHESAIWFLKFGGWEYMKELYGRFNIFPLFSIPVGAEIFLWSTRPIRYLEDLEGLKVRAAGLSIDIFEKLGAAPVWMPGGEIVPALEKGVVDAAEFAVLMEDVALGFHLVAPYLIVGTERHASNTLDVVVNLDSWNALPEHLQEAVISASREMFLLSTAISELLNAQLMEYVKDFGITIIQFDEEALAEVARVRDELLDAFAAECEFFARVLNSQREFKELYRPFVDVFHP